MGQGCHQSTGPVRSRAGYHTHPTVPLSAPLLPRFSTSPSPAPSRFISPPFSFQNALLTKRFTNPGWYIIHDRLLWDWFRQMDSEKRKEGGGSHAKGWSEKGCVTSCSSFTKPPHGPRWIFSCVLRGHTLNAHYTAFMWKEDGFASVIAERLRMNSDLPCVHASLQAFWHLWYHHDGNLTFINPESGNRGCVRCKARFDWGDKASERYLDKCYYYYYFTQVYIKNTEKCNDKYYSFVYEAKCVEKTFFSFVFFYLLFHLVILLSVLFFKVLFPTIGAFFKGASRGVCPKRGKGCTGHPIMINH